MQASSVTQKGQVTVPADIRRELGIRPGGKVRFLRKGGAVVIEAVKEPAVTSLFGVLKADRKRGCADIDAAIESARARNRRKPTRK